ncbi:MAG: pilus assembly protein PilZ [Desulfuromonas sp.]|nr:MAG: pilus assembly protein PilZ [Desulfuromonas sp.]
MPERRDLKRYRKRLQLRYGPDGPSRIGFTEDLSDTGIFLRSTIVHNPNTVLQVCMNVAGQQDVIFRGRVMWARRVPANLMNKVKGGMGVHILSFSKGEDTYRTLLDRMAKK